MKLVMNMVRKPFKAGEVIFDFGEKSDDLYLIHTGSLEFVSREGLVLATLWLCGCRAHPDARAGSPDTGHRAPDQGPGAIAH